MGPSRPVASFFLIAGAAAQCAALQFHANDIVVIHLDVPLRLGIAIRLTSMSAVDSRGGLMAIRGRSETLSFHIIPMIRHGRHSISAVFGPVLHELPRHHEGRYHRLPSICEPSRNRGRIKFTAVGTELNRPARTKGRTKYMRWKLRNLQDGKLIP